MPCTEPRNEVLVQGYEPATPLFFRGAAAFALPPSLGELRRTGRGLGLRYATPAQDGVPWGGSKRPTGNFVASVAFGCRRFAPEIWTRDSRPATRGFGPLARAGETALPRRDTQVKESQLPRESRVAGR